MKLGSRDLSVILRAATERRHYVALANMLTGTPAWPSFLARYLSGRGRYPHTVSVRTPAREIAPLLYSHHDLLTVNEIFFRDDYASDIDAQIVVDVGANIGLSALYFLTHHPRAKCHLYEPVPRNVERLRKTLVGFEDRYELTECAMSTHDGVVSFGVEETGRYGGIGVPTGQTIEVPCCAIDRVLAEIVARERFIDILKIDTEGSEIALLQAIHPDRLRSIGRIFVESPSIPGGLEESFDAQQYGNVCRLRNRNPGYRDAARCVTFS